MMALDLVFQNADETTMNSRRTIPELLAELGMDVAQLVTTSGLDRKVVEAIAEGRYTTSPQQRERIARALGVAADQIQWGGAMAVDHMYGHGPQFGRSP
jgi:hypothetical protein